LGVGGEDDELCGAIQGPPLGRVGLERDVDGSRMAQ
jgi:hypothetical protein